MKHILRSIAEFVGWSHNKTSHREKLISGVGGFTGIFLVLVMTQQIVHAEDASLLIASMGASAVLLFAVPHGPLSQPWALGGGQLISAFVGVSCYLFIPNLHIAAASAVGLSIVAMYYLRCIHPPGGATALSAVMAGPSVHALGYQFILTPVLVNVLIIFAVAILYNALFSWRRYPSILNQRSATGRQEAWTMESLGQQQLDNALQQIDHFVDISNDDLKKIFQLVHNNPNTSLEVSQLKLGHYYSNGETGANWSVRQLIDASEGEPSKDSLIIYKVVAGMGRLETGAMRRQEFVQWAKYEVCLNQHSWEQVNTPEYNIVDP